MTVTSDPARQFRPLAARVEDALSPRGIRWALRLLWGGLLILPLVWALQIGADVSAFPKLVWSMLGAVNDHFTGCVDIALHHTGGSGVETECRPAM